MKIFIRLWLILSDLAMISINFYLMKIIWNTKNGIKVSLDLIEKCHLLLSFPPLTTLSPFPLLLRLLLLLPQLSPSNLISLCISLCICICFYVCIDWFLLGPNENPRAYPLKPPTIFWVWVGVEGEEEEEDSIGHNLDKHDEWRAGGGGGGRVFETGEGEGDGGQGREVRGGGREIETELGGGGWNRGPRGAGGDKQGVRVRGGNLGLWGLWGMLFWGVGWLIGWWVFWGIGLGMFWEIFIDGGETVNEVFTFCTHLGEKGGNFTGERTLRC